MDDPTVICKSLKDLNSFLARDKFEKSKTSFNISSPTISNNYLPRLKLDFNDSTIDNDQNSIINSFNLHNETYLQRHRESIAGFDITKKIRGKDGEISEAKTTISILESRIENINSSSKKRKLDYDSDLDKIRNIQFRDKELIDDLQHKLKQFQNSEKEDKQNIIRLQRNLDENSSKTVMKHKVLQMDGIQQADKLREELKQLKSIYNDTNRELEDKTSTVKILQDSYEQLEDREKNLHYKVLSYEKSNLNCEQLSSNLSKVEFKNKELERQLHDLKKYQNQYDQFEKSIRQIPLLEKQINTLKDDNITHKLMSVNVDLVEEKLTAAESEVRYLGSKCTALTTENETLTLMAEICEKYEAAVKQEFELDYMPPVCEFVELIQDLRKRDKDATATLHVLKESLKSHENYRTANDKKVEKLEVDLKNTQLESQRLSTLLKKLQRKLILVSKERDSLKMIMNSYESETTINIGVLEQEKISKLESLLEDYKTELNKYDGDDTYQTTKSSLETKSSGQTKGIVELEEQILSLSQEKEMLELKLEQQILKGSYDPTKNKILHFIDNPLEKANLDAIAKYDTLLKENSSLKKRIQLMKEGDNVDLTQKVIGSTDDVTNERLQELKDKVTSQETKIQRMLEAFKGKSHEMREVVYRLTGYRVDLRGENNYKLINTYSESADDYLLFKEDSQGELQLMETDYSASLEEFIESYLKRGSSFPAFLSAITMDLFNRQTMIQYNSEDEEVEEDEDDDDTEEDDNNMAGEEEEDDEDHMVGGEGGEDQMLEEEEEEDEEEPMGDEEEPMGDEEEDPTSQDNDEDLICLD